jgi:hypothetical protein
LLLAPLFLAGFSPRLFEPRRLALADCVEDPPGKVSNNYGTRPWSGSPQVTPTLTTSGNAVAAGTTQVGIYKDGNMTTARNLLSPTPVTWFTIYIDYDAVSTWAPSAFSGTINDVAGRSVQYGASVPILGTPMALPGENPVTAFNAIAAGQHDDCYDAIYTTFKGRGYAELRIRPAWEMNGNWYPWSVPSGKGASFVAAFQHIYTHAKAWQAANGMTVTVIFNPCWGVSRGIESPMTYAASICNEYCDEIGVDQYTGWDSQPAVSNLNDTNVWSVKVAAQYAVQYNKPFSLPETGCPQGMYSTWAPALQSCLQGVANFANVGCADICFYDDAAIQPTVSLEWEGCSSDVMAIKNLLAWLPRPFR